MQSFDELYKEYVNYDHAQRVEIARTAAGRILAALEQNGIEDEIKFSFLIDIVKLFVSADKKCSESECELFNDVIGTSLSYEQFFHLTNGGADPHFIAGIDNIIDSLSGDIKAEICFFGLTILCADDTFTQEEREIFEKIIA